MMKAYTEEIRSFSDSSIKYMYFHKYVNKTCLRKPEGTEYVRKLLLYHILLSTMTQIEICDIALKSAFFLVMS